MEELEQIEILTGSPDCPMCGKLLSLRSMPDLGETPWHCTGCGTQWRTGDLIDALNQNLAISWALGKADEVSS